MAPVNQAGTQLFAGGRAATAAVSGLLVCTLCSCTRVRTLPSGDVHRVAIQLGLVVSLGFLWERGGGKVFVAASLAVLHLQQLCAYLAVSW